MSDTLPDGTSEGLDPMPAPKKRVVRKSTTRSETTPRKTPGRKKAADTESASSSPVETVLPLALEPSNASDDAATPVKKVVRRKRVTKAEQEGVQAQETAPSSPRPKASVEESPEVSPAKPVRKRVVRKKVTPIEEPSAAQDTPTPAPAPPREKEPSAEAPSAVPREVEAPSPTQPPVERQPAREQNGDAYQASRPYPRNGRQNQNQNRQDQGDNPRYQRQQGQGQGDNRNNKFRNNNNNKGRRDNNRNFNQGDRPPVRENLRDARTRNKKNNNNNENREPQQPRQPIEFGPPEEVDGLLEITPKGFGFLRNQETGFEQAKDAVYVSNELIRSHGLRHAVWIHGLARRHPKGIQLTEITTVNGKKWQEARLLPHFDELKAVNPNKRIVFETVPERYTTRTLDLVAPVGRGQRGLIVAPPRTGKTTFLQHMAEAIRENYRDSMHLMILLIDERPEEVTEFQRNIQGAEVYASSNDGKVRDHCRLAELCIERARRLVEAGEHVFLLMDSITRLARAYNNADKGSGRTMSGGIDARALEMPRRLFAAARNTRQAGSLTIVATALIETNSRMDDLIFQEFKGTGNMELVLNRRIAEQYIYPAVDILKSGTRREELILPENWLYKIHLIRRALAGHKPVEAMERFLFFLRKYPNNTQMLLDLKQRV